MSPLSPRGTPPLLEAQGGLGREVTHLRQTVEGLKEELAALCACLENLGLLRSSQMAALLHRRRFEGVLRCYPCTWSTLFMDVVHDPGVLHPILRFAGVSAMKHVAACTPTLRLSSEVSQRYAIRPVRLYFLGGSLGEGPPLDSTLCLNVASGTWEELAPMPTPRDVLAAAAIGSRIYAIGGKDEGRAYAATECYDAELGRWMRCCPMAIARGGLGAVASGNLVYAVGGSDGRRALSVVERYDPVQNLWSRAFSLLTPRRGVAVAACGACLYAVGGTDGNEVLSSVEHLNTSGGVPWSPLPPMLRARRAASAAAVQGRVCVVGGAGGLGHNDGCIELAECFDPERCIWEALPSMAQPRRGMALLAVDHLLYAFGGSDGERTLGSVEVFDSQQGTWEAQPAMPLRRGYFGAAQTQILEVLGLSVGPENGLREALRQAVIATRPSTVASALVTPENSMLPSPLQSRLPSFASQTVGSDR